MRDDEQLIPPPEPPEPDELGEDGGENGVGVGFNPAPTDALLEQEAPQPPESVVVDRRLAGIISRVDALTEAIERYPDSPVNYVLRGEALLEGGDNDLAADDFLKAIELAEPRAETANWGYIHRAMAGRAREGLRRARGQTTSNL